MKFANDTVSKKRPERKTIVQLGNSDGTELILKGGLKEWIELVLVRITVV